VAAPAALVALAAFWLAFVPGRSHAAAPGGTCVVAGGFPDEEIDRAAKLAQKIQGLGFDGAGVFDGAAFRNFTTDLVVIAATFPDAKADRPAASAALKRLARGKVSAYLKGCTPVGAPPAALASRPARAPVATTEIAPLPDIPAQLPIGCWGWSVKRTTALCTTGQSTWQTGAHWDLDVLGRADWDEIALDDRDQLGTEADQRRLKPDQRAQLEKDVVDGDVGSLGVATAKLQPNQTFHAWAPRLTVRWDRKLDHHQAHDLGSWDVWDDRVLVRCGGPGAADQEAFSDVGSGGGEALVYVLPDHAHALVQLRKDRAEEGEYGPIVSAVLIDMSRDRCSLFGADHPHGPQ
jgi:hypothetical protein